MLPAVEVGWEALEAGMMHGGEGMETWEGPFRTAMQTSRHLPVVVEAEVTDGARALELNGQGLMGLSSRHWTVASPSEVAR